MAKTLKLASKSLKTLEEQARKLETDLCDMMMAETKDESKFNSTMALSEAYGYELDRRSQSVSLSIKKEPSANNFNNAADHRALQLNFHDTIPMFGPGVDVSYFITALDNCYKAYVTKENNLELIFCRNVSSKLKMQYQTSYVNMPETDRSTWAQVKAYLKSAYAPKETIFQTLSHLWDLSREPSENIHQFGIRMEEKGAEVLNRVEAIWKDKHKDQNPAPQFTVAALTNIISSMLVVQHIRRKEPEVYRSMINDLDTCFKPTDITLKAQTYVDRFGQSDLASINT